MTMARSRLMSLSSDPATASAMRPRRRSGAHPYLPIWGPTSTSLPVRDWTARGARAFMDIEDAVVW